MHPSDIIANVDRVYTQRISEMGATPQGVFWNGEESQRIRFDQLLKICDGETGFSLLDYGCGYGALLGYMQSMSKCPVYTGFDICEAMVQHACLTHPEATFTSNLSTLTQYDYVVESGIFNLRLDTEETVWQTYVLDILDKMARLSRKGFAANFLTTYKDPEYIRPDHFYADPGFLFDYCKKRYSTRVALLHDYELYEFTILVRKSEDEPWLTKDIE